MNGLRIGSLFSGIGGLELGLERAGVGRTVWQCEIDPWARGILARHWPGVPCHDDIRTFHPGPGSADLVAGGFPCQDVSQAGRGEGIREGTRSGLWSEYVRVLREVRPRFVIVENVAILRKRGLDQVLGDLAALGYDAEWDCIEARAVGAPHPRDRLFVLAHLDDGRRLPGPAQVQPADARKPPQRQPEPSPADAPDADGLGPHRAGTTGKGRAEPANGAAYPACLGRGARSALQEFRQSNVVRGGVWGPGSEYADEPPLVRAVHGVPGRVDRIRGLGNSVVPQVAEFIGRRLRMTFGLEGSVKP